jgi:hypothetical protein
MVGITGKKILKNSKHVFMLGKALSLYGYKINMKFKFKKSSLNILAMK